MMSLFCFVLFCAHWNLNFEENILTIWCIISAKCNKIYVNLGQAFGKTKLGKAFRKRLIIMMWYFLFIAFNFLKYNSALNFGNKVCLSDACKCWDSWNMASLSSCFIVPISLNRYHLANYYIFFILVYFLLACSRQ